MTTLNHTCFSCESQFKISYNEMNMESDPQYCPFCGEYLITDPIELDDEDDDHL